MQIYRRHFWIIIISHNNGNNRRRNDFTRPRLLLLNSPDMELPGNYLIVFYPKVYVIARSNTSNAAADEVKSSRDTFLCFAEFATNFLVKIAT